MRSILLITALSAAACAQSLVFEVAAVKPNHTGNNPRTYPRLHNGTFRAEIASLRTLLVIAYGMIELRIDGPDWLSAEKFDITAKAPEGVPDSELKPLLQSLLKERFHLETHFETREVPIYQMVVSKGGSKLTLFDPEHPPKPPAIRGQNTIMGASTASQIADSLSRAAGRPILDKTGLDGRFGWAIRYSSLAADANPGDAPDLFVAIEQQLGLKLEPKKDALQILVIDHIDRVPIEN